ncbi:MAG: hypothetical protein KGL69_09680 [Alphaproteobacteria bacterium]|nr:hypothetical protein [Alphaproteobacteria bacterium]
MRSTILAVLLAAASLQGVQAAPAAKPAKSPVTLNTNDDSEPLPANAPKDPYLLAAWCYGALDQYLYIYDQIVPQLRAIDKEFGSSVKNEAQPYADDMAAARDEAKVLAGAVEAAEKASLKVIAPQGAAAVRQGRAIWSVAETNTPRRLADAWLSWGLPDACDTNARALTAKSALLGEALKYNGPSATAEPPAPVVFKSPSPDDGASVAAPAPDAPPDAPTTPSSSDAKTDAKASASGPDPAPPAGPHG